MRGRPCTFLTTLSLLLLGAVGVMWGRSYWVCDGLDWPTADGRAGVANLDGRFSAGVVHVGPAYVAKIPKGLRFSREPAAEAAATAMKPGASLLGVQAVRVTTPGIRVVDLRVPHAYAAALFALLPASRLATGRRRARRRRAGLCVRCGYDLRGSRESGCCSECGMVVPRTTVGPTGA